MIENALYVGGRTKGSHATSYGTVGTAVCWETIRTPTVKRLFNEVDFLMTGSHWWTSASNWSAFKRLLKLKEMDVKNRAMLLRAPATLSTLLGVANIHASHCGDLKGTFPVLPRRILDLNFESVLLGETQIVDNQGQVVARRTEQEGPGVITADIDLARNKTLGEFPDGYWLPPLPLRAKLIWWQQNFIGKGIYKQAKREGRL